ncbi:hypothetical protein AAG906_037907 [Vitis piasezkii]
MKSKVRKFIPRCEFLKSKFRTPLFKVRKFSHCAKFSPGTRVPFRTPQGQFRTMRIKVRNLFQGAKTLCKVRILHISFSHTPVQGAKHLPAHEWKFAHLKPLFAPCETRCEIFAPRPFRLPILTDASTTNQVLVSGEPSQPPQAEPPTEDSQIPVGIPLETVIRRPMIAGPPIEGNLDCRDRSFHSETYFDIEALERARDSFDYCRYHMEHLLAPRQFYYPRVALDFYQSMTTRGVRNPTLIHFTIDGRHGAIGARHIAEALRIPYEPVTQVDFREWSSFSQRDMVRILSGDFYLGVD